MNGVRRRLPRIWNMGPTRSKTRLELEISELYDEAFSHNVSPRCETKFLMAVYPLSFLQEGAHSKKQRVAAI